jgi:glycosyltransferase involved in cell wall biosynthesis
MSISDSAVQSLVNFLTFDYERNGFPASLVRSFMFIGRLKVEGQINKVVLYLDLTRLITHNSYSGISLTTYKIYTMLKNVEFLDVRPVYNAKYINPDTCDDEIILDYVGREKIVINNFKNLVLKKSEYDSIYHSLYYPFPSELPINIIKVITLYDIIHLTSKKYYPDPSKFVTGDIAKSCLDADLVMSISDYSLNELIAYNGCSVNSIVTPLASMVERESHLLEHDISRIETLTFAFQGGDPRKNFDRMLRVAELWLAESTESKRNICIFGNIKLLKLKYPAFSNFDTKRIVLCEFPSDVELIAIYKMSSIYLYLSEMEGFGLPPLEAMQFGCPAIMLDNSSLSEVFKGWVGLLPQDSADESIVKTLNSVLENHNANRKAAVAFSDNYNWNVTLGLLMAGYILAVEKFNEKECI